MPPPLLKVARSEALAALLREASERARAHASASRKRAQEEAEARRAHERRMSALFGDLARLESLTRSNDVRRREVVAEALRLDREVAEEARGRALAEAARRYEAGEEQIGEDLRQATWEWRAVYEAEEAEELAAIHAERHRLDEAGAALAAIRSGFDRYRRRGGIVIPGDNQPLPEGFDPGAGSASEALGEARSLLDRLRPLGWPRIYRLSMALYLVPPIAFGAIATLAGRPDLGLLAAAVLALAIFAIRRWLRSTVARRLAAIVEPLSRRIVEAERRIASERDRAEAAHSRRNAELEGVRNGRQVEASRAFGERMAEIEGRRERRLAEVEAAFAGRVAELEVVGPRASAWLEQQVEPRIASLRKAHAKEVARAEEAFVGQLAELRRASEAEADRLGRQRESARRRILEALAEARGALGVEAAPWDDPAWDDWTPASAFPSTIRIGEVRVEPEALAGPAVEGPAPTVAFPASWPLRGRPALLIEVGGPEALAAAEEALRAAAYRIATSFPPGKVEFVVASTDPGRADFDPMGGDARGCSADPEAVERRLSDLFDHIEAVGETYLGREFATLAEYNAAAGDLAEPFRVLVLPDFPAGFPASAAGTLSAILRGGARAGVLVLIALDRGRPMPAGLALSAIRAQALSLATAPGPGRGGGALEFIEHGGDAERLTLDSPPTDLTASSLISRVEAAAKAARGAVVPFEFAAPAPDRRWRGDSRAGLEIGLGRAVPSRVQALRLGDGEARHTLIVGRVGSGKASLLRALVVGAAMTYSPDELEMHLIGFGDGGDFEPFAASEPPQARVIGVDAPREFAVAALRRIEGELRERSESLRKAGVRDLAGYRRAESRPIPRVLVVVDGYPELVSVGDLADEAAAVIRGLARLDPGLGLHLVLAARTLEGLPALALETLAKVSVRIALACPEADAARVFREDNTAPRRLARAGQAIYNAARGEAAANVLFQVGWLSEEATAEPLRLARESSRTAWSPPVFRGSSPARLEASEPLRRSLEAGAWPDSPKAAVVALGESLAIGEPPRVVFRRQGGHNLLVVGQGEDATLALVTASILGLAAHYPPPSSDQTRSGARFTLLDGTPEDAPRAGHLRELANRLPHPVTLVGEHGAAQALRDLADELKRRHGAEGGDGPEWFLVVHHLEFLHALRRRDARLARELADGDRPAADDLALLICEGPTHGLHVLASCDSLRSLDRVLDPATLDHFGMRVLFRMGRDDSLRLAGGVQAVDLGPLDAILSADHTPAPETFRPFGLPPRPWLDQAGKLLWARSLAIRSH